MDHIAIDLGGRESQICIRASSGEIVEELRWPTAKLQTFFAKRAPSRVILETCAEAFALADRALACQHDVRVVPSVLAPTLGVGHRGIKNDQRDARVLSEASCRVDLPSVHISSAWSRQIKSLCAMRDNLVGARRQLINGVQGFLRTQIRRPRPGNGHTFAQRVRELADIPLFVERQLVCIDTLTTQIRAADKEVSKLANDTELCRRLMTVPGIGPVTAVRFVATVDDVTRFSDAHQLESYLGIVPGENSSSERKRRTGITKAGTRAFRANLVQAAWATYRACKLQPIGRWALEIERRRGKQIMIVALARKLAGILFAMWRDGTPYLASKAAHDAQ
jgi:transposase